MQKQVVKTVDTWLRSGLKSEYIKKIVRERSVKLSTRTRRVLYNKQHGGFGFSAEFMHARGITEDSDILAERTSEMAFETIERLGQSICTSAPYVCQDIELCQRLNLQKLGEHVHTQRYREAAKDDLYQADLDKCLEQMQDWPTDVVQAARAYYDTEGADHWSFFVLGGGLFQYRADCSFSEHIKLQKTAWPLHSAFTVSCIAGGCLMAASLRKKMQLFPAVSVCPEHASECESPQVLLGLAAASGDYCALGYADVPELADYVIHDYDGKESVGW